MLSCKEGETDSAKRKSALDSALNAIHYENIFEIRDYSMNKPLLTDWGDEVGIRKIMGDGSSYELMILDPAPFSKPAIGHVPCGWSDMPGDISHIDKTSGKKILEALEKLITREDRSRWGEIIFLKGQSIEDSHILENFWIVPFIFVRYRMFGPLSGSGEIYWIDVLLDGRLQLISIIATGGRVWTS